MTPLPDLILANANVITMDRSLPSARSVFIRGGRIAAVSSRNEPDLCDSPRATYIDCRGRTLTPGFIDAHCHLFAYAKGLSTLDVGPSRVASIAQIQEAVLAAARALPQGAWITASGYDEFHLAEKRHPTRWDLDAAANPVSLVHRSGHAHVLNSAALALAGISRETGDPADALIDRDLITGEPTGLLFGMHGHLAQVAPALAGERADLAIQLASRSLSALGITSVHDTSPRNGMQRLAQFRRWCERGLLATRVDMVLSWDEFERLGATRNGLPDLGALVRITGVKLLIHEITGRLSPPQADLNRRVDQIHAAGFQAVMHAVEPLAIEAACTAVEQALARLPRADHRHRIEHCSVCPPSLARRIAAAGILVVTQPGFIYRHGERYLATVPAEDIAHLYPLATLVGCGVEVAGSADMPVGPADPLIGMHAAVCRRSKGGAAVAPGQAISPTDALQLYTVHAARALRAERDRGTIKPGFLADLVVLSDDPTRRQPDDAASIRVDITVIGGQVVFTRK